MKANPALINVVLALLAAANLLNMLAFTTTAWGRVYSVSGGGFFGFGLWRICSSGTQSFSVGSLCTDTTGWPQGKAEQIYRRPAGWSEKENVITW